MTVRRHHFGRLRTVLLLLCWLPGVALAEEPSLEFDTDGRLVLHSLPAVLADDEVRPHLTRGLTTTFLFQVKPKGFRLKTTTQDGARIEIRYELWDEVFHVAAGTADGQVVRRTLDSFGELESWWKELRLVVTGPQLFHDRPDPPPPRPDQVGRRDRGRRAEVRLDVVPFSKAEQREAQRWFSDSLDDAASDAGDELADSADTSPDTLERTFHLLMATSIQRPPLASFIWTVPVS